MAEWPIVRLNSIALTNKNKRYDRNTSPLFSH